jgi:hypothetical protein
VTETHTEPEVIDSRVATLFHSLRVGHFMTDVIRNLVDRSVAHDFSKTQPPEVAGFDRATARLSSMAYGSPEYEASRAELAPTLEHHYAHNAHHPEHGEPGLEWRPVAGYEGYYKVSNYGDVHSETRVVPRSGAQGDLTLPGKYLRTNVTPKGYLRIQLAKNGTQKNFMVHRLVASAFLDNPDQLPEVNHRDGNKKNNHVANLEWVTGSDNQLHAYETGLREPNVKYVVTCPELDITTMGTVKMEQAVRAAGHTGVTAAGIWLAMNRGGTHASLTFEGSLLAEYRRSRVAKMNLADLVEMLADWRASTERMGGTGDLRKSIEINAERFGIEPQLTEILINTAVEFGWIPRVGE